RFELEYIGEDGERHRPVMVHRALFGSVERFLGILIEHYAGAFPFWLAPVQARVIPVGEDHREAGRELHARLAEEGFRGEVDDRDDTLGKRSRDPDLEKVPFVVVYGDREAEAARAWRTFELLALRERGGEQSDVSL